MASGLETLRAEILESQKERSDLLKWKLVLVAAVGAAAYGLNGMKSHAILLAAIPLLRVYVDLLCVASTSESTSSPPS